MSTAFKYRLLLVFSVICFFGIVAQGIYLWQLNQQFTTLELSKDSKVRGIEEKILAEMDKSPEIRSPWDPLASFPSAPYDPFAGIRQLQQRMDSLFGTASPFGPGSMLRQPGFGNFGFTSQSHSIRTPAIELKETNEEYEVVISVAPDQDIELNTTLEDNSLSVAGVIKSEVNNQTSNSATSFVSQSQFSRIIDLPKPIDSLGMHTRKTDEGIVISVPKKSV